MIANFVQQMVIEKKRWLHFILICILFPSMVSFIPFSPEKQNEDDQGYWDLIDITQDSKWLGSNYRGMKATYEPFFEGDFTIGAVYEEMGIQLNPKNPPRVFLNERAICTLEGFDFKRRKLMLPGDVVELTLGVQGSLIGEGTVKEVHKAGLRFYNPEDSSVNKNILYVETFQDKTTSENMTDESPKTAHIFWVVPEGKTPNEVRTLEMSCFVAGGIVQVYKNFKYRWVVQETSSDVENESPDVPKPPKEITPTTDSKCKPPYNGTQAEKLKEILDQYYKTIPVGVYSSGAKNNIMSWLPGYSHLSSFKCGGYQLQVINFLQNIKFNLDPCIAGLLDDYDYGPIQAWFRGHQAVVLYPRGTDWLVSGIVLDPWMNQKPEVYTIKKWVSMWSQFKSYGGIGPSVYYGAVYPTHGGNYELPGGTNLTPEQRDYIKSLPKSQYDQFNNMNSSGKLEFLRRYQENIKQGKKFITHSPLTIYVTDAEGRKSGMVDGNLLREIPDVVFSAFPLSDGTIVSQLEFPPTANYSLTAQGTGNGNAHVFSTFMSPNEEFTPGQSYVYAFKAENGGQYRLGSDPGSDLTANNGALKAKPLDAAAEDMIKSLPDIPIPPVYMNAPTVEKAPQTASVGEEGDSLFWGMGAGLVCLCVGVVGIVGVVILVLILRKKNRQTG